MFFDNINGTSGGTGDSNSNNDNDKYSLKNVSLRQGRAFLKDEKKVESHEYLFSTKHREQPNCWNEY